MPVPLSEYWGNGAFVLYPTDGFTLDYSCLNLSVIVILL